MRIWSVFHTTLLRNARDRGSLLQMLLLPIVLIWILGSALNADFEVRELGPSRIALLGHEEGSGTELVMEFLQNPDIAELLEVHPVKTLPEGQALLAERHVHAVVDISEFTGVTRSPEPAAIVITASSAASFRGKLLEGIFGSFIQGANTVQAQAGAQASVASYSYAGPFVNEEPVAGAADMPRAIDYYAVTMLVMMILYGANYASYGMAEDFLDPVGRRIRSTPILPLTLFAGKVFGSMATLFLQILVLLLFTSQVYGVNWGSSPLTIAAICLSASVFATALGIALLVLLRDIRTASNALNILVPVFTFVAGGYVRITNPGPLLDALRRLSPNYLTQTALFNTIYDGPGAETLLSMGILWAAAGVMFLTGVLAIRRQVL